MGNNLALPWIASCIQRPARPRKLRLRHFAFIRVLVQGLDTRVAWNRYLRLKGDHGDARTVRKMIAWLRDEFATAARRCQRHGAARLVLVDLVAVMTATLALPAMADFVAERGLVVLPRPNNWPPMKPSTATARSAMHAVRGSSVDHWKRCAGWKALLRSRHMRTTSVRGSGYDIAGIAPALR